MTFTSRKAFLAAGAAFASITIFPRVTRAADDLRVAFLPEVATTSSSMSEKQPFVDMLQKATGRRVRLIIPSNYAATVEAMGSESVDFAHFGGLTYLKASQRYSAKPLVQRLEDRRFHSLFITSEKAKIGSLKDLRGKQFAFGDVNSTSGHLIPAKELFDAGIDPDKDLTTRYTGNHTNTAIAVAAGQVDAGAIDESVYRKMVTDKTIDGAKAKVFYTSHPFVDYVWATRKDLDPEVVQNLRHAFLQEHDRKVLDVLRATYYVTANDKEYDPLREIARRLGLL